MNQIGVNLVVGATGKTGRRVVDRLQELGLHYRGASRSSQALFDWERRETWQQCLDGITNAYVAYYPDLCVPGAVETLQAFFAQAVDAKVRKIVFLSGRGEPDAERAEQVLQACDVDWTILRCSFFCQNFSESFVLVPILSGEVALPVNSVGEPFVDADDIAEAAVAALTSSQHSRQLYELTGPRALTFASAIEAIAEATGRNIRFRSVTSTEYRAALAEAQVPAEVVELVLYLFGTLFDGRNEAVGDGVQRALGRRPRDFREYVKRTAATGIWAK